MQRPLFGGAITVIIPQGWKDVSEIRQVPDHQECWQFEDRLLVVEILERMGGVEEEASQFHANSGPQNVHSRSFFFLDFETVCRCTFGRMWSSDFWDLSIVGVESSNWKARGVERAIICTTL